MPGPGPKRDKGITAIIPLRYFQSHECHLKGHIATFGVHCSKWRKMLLNLTTVRTDDVRARSMFKSYATLSAEKYRQFIDHPFTIHPYSVMRIWLQIMMVIANLISNTVLAIHYVHKPVSWCYGILVIYLCDSIILMYLVTKFFTGYIEGYLYRYAILDPRKIFSKYARTWLIIDLLSLMSVIPTIYKIRNITLHVVLVSTRLLRMPSVFFSVSDIAEAFKCGIIQTTLTQSVLLIYSYLFWNIFFQFAVEYILEDSYTPANPRECSWLSVAKFWNASTAERFSYALERSVGMLHLNSNMNYHNRYECLELFHVVMWIFARLLIYHCGLKYIVSMYGQQSASAKYVTMTRQVERYMNQRKLPPRIKKKILKFYAIRYQSCFFVEAPILSCVSGLLREDIIMHTGGQLVRQLEFLKQLPRALLLQLSFKLKLVIFIAGDIIYKINSVGDCLYFIDKGTVAVYSAAGKEICHLEDDNFFGEIALVMKYRFRTTSVVAVTNCELFRLDRDDFNSSIACFPTVYEHIKSVATHRLERTNVIDEQHTIEMRNVD